MEKFKYTEPIRLTGIHKIIFGKVREKLQEISSTQLLTKLTYMNLSPGWELL